MSRTERHEHVRKTTRGGMLVNDRTAKTFGRFKCSCCAPSKEPHVKRVIKRRERQTLRQEIYDTLIEDYEERIEAEVNYWAHEEDFDLPSSLDELYEDDWYDHGLRYDAYANDWYDPEVDDDRDWYDRIYADRYYDEVA